MQYDHIYCLTDIQIGMEVRSKRHGNLHGRIVQIIYSEEMGGLPYNIKVEWNNSRIEWCRAGELRPSAEQLEKWLDKITDNIMNRNDGSWCDIIP